MEDFEDLDLPNRLIAAGEEPLGERVNAYQKMKTLRSIFDALDEAEKIYLSSSQFGKLLDFPNLPSFSATFVLFLLSRQLEVAKSNEIWFVFGGTPVRLSLREFKLVTGLRCDKFPTVTKKRKKNTAGKKIPFYSTLFGLEEDVTVERVITMLKKRIVTDEHTRRMYACLAIVDGYLVPTSHYPKILKEHAEMCEDFDSFLTYPWGRLSFQMMITSIKERDVEQLATTSVAVQGLVYAIQLVVLYAAPSIQDGPPADGNNFSESEAESPAERIASQVVSFKLGNAKEIDKNCKAKVSPIICPDVEEEMITEDLTWSDDEEDERVDNIVMLAKDGFKFSNEMFQGGCIPSEVQVAPKKQKRIARGKVVRSRKTYQCGRPQQSSNQASSSKESLSVPRYVDINSLARMLDDKLAAQEKRIISSVIDWFDKHVSVSGDKGVVDNEENGTQHQPTTGTVHRNSSERGRGPGFSEDVQTSSEKQPGNLTQSNENNVVEYVANEPAPATSNAMANCEVQCMGNEIGKEIPGSGGKGITNPVVGDRLDCIVMEIAKESAAACGIGIPEVEAVGNQSGSAYGKVIGDAEASHDMGVFGKETVSAGDKVGEDRIVMETAKESAAASGIGIPEVEAVGNQPGSAYGKVIGDVEASYELGVVGNETGSGGDKVVEDVAVTEDGVGEGQGGHDSTRAEDEVDSSSGTQNEGGSEMSEDDNHGSDDADNEEAPMDVDSQLVSDDMNTQGDNQETNASDRGGNTDNISRETFSNDSSEANGGDLLPPSDKNFGPEEEDPINAPKTPLAVVSELPFADKLSAKV